MNLLLSDETISKLLKDAFFSTLREIPSRRLPELLEKEDLIQAGYEGILRAAKKIPPDSVTEDSFRAYAFRWAKGQMLTEVQNHVDNIIRYDANEGGINWFPARKTERMTFGRANKIDVQRLKAAIQLARVRRVRPDSISGFVGVTSCPKKSKTNPWASYVIFSDKRCDIGLFPTAEAAADARDKFLDNLLETIEQEND